jgi:integrase
MTDRDADAVFRDDDIRDQLTAADALSWAHEALARHSGTVQAWLGHESIATTNRYLHFVGTGADLAGLDRLNRPRNESQFRAGYPRGKQPADGEGSPP